MKRLERAVWLVLLLGILSVLSGCGDRMFWKYLMRGTMLSFIKNGKTELYLDYSPRFAYLFDKDRDGDQDLLVVTSDDLIFSYTNLVEGRFSRPPLAYIVESVPQQVAVGDFNGDGFPDFAVANQGSDDIAVLFNSGKGTFDSMYFMDAGNEPYAIATADLDSNGTLDLVVANIGENTLMIFSGDGKGNFDLQKTIPIGETPFGLVITDLDGNGYPDLAAVNYDSDDLSVIRNAGDFYFHAEEVYPVGGHPSSLVDLDFDRDGFPDLAVTQFGADSLAILMNNGHGEFERMLRFATGKSPYWVTRADLDFNGWQDLIVANYAEDSLSFYMNSPDYLDRFKMAIPGKMRANHVAVGRLNANPYFDVVICDFDARTVLVQYDLFRPQEF